MELEEYAQEFAAKMMNQIVGAEYLPDAEYMATRQNFVNVYMEHIGPLMDWA